MPQISLSPRSASRSLLAREHTRASECQFAAGCRGNQKSQATGLCICVRQHAHLSGRKRTATLILWQLVLLASEPRS